MASEVIGIIGAAGDLGKRLAVQASAHFENVQGVDLPDRVWDLSRGVVPDVMAEDMITTPQIMSSIDEVMENASIVHWCAPLRLLPHAPALRPDQLLVLHGSVMAVSDEAKTEYEAAVPRAGTIGIVHFAMSEAGMVSVAAENEDNDRVVDHIERLGLTPRIRSIEEHDTLAALTQGLAAVLKHVVVPRLQALGVDGDLTPSGQRLIDGIMSTAAVWTDETYETIRRNPQLPNLIASILAEIQPTSLDKVY